MRDIMVEIEILEEEGDKLKLKVNDNTTVLNLINENLWKQKSVDLAAVTIDHPYLAKPVITIKSKKGKKAVIEAAEKIAEDAAALRKKLAAELK
jgi:DNA-directed RNA polymerase subunit L